MEKKCIQIKKIKICAIAYLTEQKTLRNLSNQNVLPEHKKQVILHELETKKYECYAFITYKISSCSMTFLL